MERLIAPVNTRAYISIPFSTILSFEILTLDNTIEYFVSINEQ